MGKVVFPKGAATPAPGPDPIGRTAAVRPTKAVDSSDATDEADLRLMIEESEEAGGYVYVIVDRKTGKVVSRLTREDVLRLREKSNYTAGAVFDGKA
jgi:uncharacterized FlaG/YvyC family protein